MAHIYVICIRLATIMVYVRKTSKGEGRERETKKVNERHVPGREEKSPVPI